MTIYKMANQTTKKWISKLNRTDAEYFYDKGVIKDIALFCTLSMLKGLKYREQFDFEKDLYRYLQAQMLLNLVSDDERDTKQAHNFFDVPFNLEEISKGKVYRLTDDEIDNKLTKWKKTPLHLYYNSSANDIEILLKACPKHLKPILEQVLSYYSTPIIAFVTIKGMSLKDFSFNKELVDFLRYIVDKHFKNKVYSQQLINDYIEVMNLIANKKLKNAS